MTPIRVRTATGTEHSFASREELGRAVETGRVNAKCEVFHARRNRWISVTQHPVWPSVSSLKSESAPPARGRSSDLVLIYPDFMPTIDPSQPPAAAVDLVDPFDAGPILAPDEIHRVLHAPRTSGPTPRVTVPEERPLFEKAMPTFSKAFTSLLG